MERCQLVHRYIWKRGCINGSNRRHRGCQNQESIPVSHLQSRAPGWWSCRPGSGTLLSQGHDHPNHTAG